jgi:hypothetical protein
MDMLTARLNRLSELRADEKRTARASYELFDLEDWFGSTEDYICDLLDRVKELEAEVVALRGPRQ